MKKRVLCTILVIAMLFTWMPMALAADWPVTAGSGATQMTAAIVKGASTAPDSISVTATTGDIGLVLYDKDKEIDGLDTGGYDTTIQGALAEGGAGVFDGEGNKLTEGTDFARNKDTASVAATFPTTANGTWVVWAQNFSAASVLLKEEVEIVNGKIKEPLSVNTGAITKSDATVGTALTIDLTGKVSGGSGTYDYALDSGTLPAGLTLANGRITGTPTAVTSGEVTLTVKVSDDGKAADAADKTWASDKITVKLTVGKGAATVALAPASGTYTGAAHTPTVTVKLAGTASTSFSTTWAPTGLTDAGTYTGTVALTGDADDNYAITGSNTVTYTINTVNPVVDIDKTQITEDTTLADIADLVTVTGVGSDTLTEAGFQLVDETGAALTDLTAKVVPDQKYYYTYRPDDTTNYNTLTKVEVTLLSQTKATVKFEVAAADADKGSIAAADATAEFDKDAAVTFPTVTLSEGFTLKGWTVKGGDGKLVDTATAKAVDGTVYVAVFEAKPAHAAYLFGTTKDGTTFEPDRDMTRAEVAVMIANLDGYDKTVDYSKDLKIPADLLAEKDNLTKWTDNGFNKLCFILKGKIMQGRDDGDFHPYDTITRQEMAIVLGRYMNLTPATGADQFNDLTGTAVYAEGKGYINALKADGKINGFPDGGYHPIENLTRAQAAKMMNSALLREPDIAKMKAANATTAFNDVKVFAGNSQAEWALYNIIEASQNHYESAFH